MKIGYIGLGSQGAGMAEMIARSQHELTVWARRPGVTDFYAGLGARVAESPAALAAACDIVGLCVMSGSDVEEVLLAKGMLDAMRPGTVIAIQSTVTPALCRALGEAAQARGVHLVDAPVSGSSDGARARTLLVLTGGTQAAIAAATPMFETYAGQIVHCGGLGDAQTAKLLNNALFFANSELVDQAFAIGRQFGLDPELMRVTFLAGSARSAALDVYPNLCHPAVVAHSKDLVEKDVVLFAKLAAEKDIALGDLGAVGRACVETVAAAANKLTKGGA